MSGSLTDVTVGAAYRNEFGLRNFEWNCQR